MKIKIPREVKVGSYDYKIIKVPKLASDYKLLGQSITDSQLIKIEPDVTDQTKNQAFWHEVVHAIADVYNCELDEPNVDRIAQGVSAVLKDRFGIEFDWSEIEG